MIKWKIDTAHSEVIIKAKYLNMTLVTGYLKQFDIRMDTYDENVTTASSIEFTGEVASLSTNNIDRDAHLASADFFDTEKFPAITFSATKWEHVAGEWPHNFNGPHLKEYKLYGDLTIKDITHPVVFDVTYEGCRKDAEGLYKAGFQVRGQIFRKDFGIGWDKTAANNRPVIANEVKINCEIQLFKQ